MGFSLHEINSFARSVHPIVHLAVYRTHCISYTIPAAPHAALTFVQITIILLRSLCGKDHLRHTRPVK